MLLHDAVLRGCDLTDTCMLRTHVSIERAGSTSILLPGAQNRTLSTDETTVS